MFRGFVLPSRFIVSSRPSMPAKWSACQCVIKMSSILMKLTSVKRICLWVPSPQSKRQEYSCSDLYFIWTAGCPLSLVGTPAVVPRNVTSICVMKEIVLEGFYKIFSFNIEKFYGLFFRHYPVPVCVNPPENLHAQTGFAPSDFKKRGNGYGVIRLLSYRPAGEIKYAGRVSITRDLHRLHGQLIFPSFIRSDIAAPVRATRNRKNDRHHVVQEPHIYIIYNKI